MADIKIIVDTGSDIPPELAEKYDIDVISFLSIFGDEQYVQRVDITNEEFFDKLENYDGIPTTSQTPFGDMLDFFREQCENHESVIYFALSSAASGQYQTANIVKGELEEENPNIDFRIVDTQKFSLFIAQTAIYASNLVRDGKSVDEIIEKSQEYINSWRCYLLVDTLKYLEKGGRLSKAAAFVGTMLDIKPILTIENGLVESLDKLRGKKKLLEKLIEKVQDDDEFDSENPKFMVVQSDETKGQKVCDMLRDEFGEDCIELYGEFGPLIGTHVGRGAIAILSRILP